MTTTNEPGSMFNETPCRARTSFGVPAKNALRMFLISSIARPFLFPGEERGQPWQDQRGEHEDRGDQLEVVRIEPDSKRNGDEQPEQDRPHDGADDQHSQLPGADERL